MKLVCKNKSFTNVEKRLFGKDKQYTTEFDLTVGETYDVDFCDYASYGSYYYGAYIKGDTKVFNIKYDKRAVFLFVINHLFEVK